MTTLSAELYRFRAEQMRVLADMETNTVARKLILQAADDYEARAAEADVAERAARVERMNAAVDALGGNVVRGRFGGAA